MDHWLTYDLAMGKGSVKIRSGRIESIVEDTEHGGDVNRFTITMCSGDTHYIKFDGDINQLIASIKVNLN